MLRLVKNEEKPISDEELAGQLGSIAEADLSEGADIADHPIMVMMGRYSDSQKDLATIKEFLEHLVKFNCYGAEGAEALLAEIYT